MEIDAKQTYPKKDDMATVTFSIIGSRVMIEICGTTLEVNAKEFQKVADALKRDVRDV